MLLLTSVATLFCLFVSSVIFIYTKWLKILRPPNKRDKPESVNYHFTRQCNYSCGFCFHTAKTSFVLPETEAKRGLKLLMQAGMIAKIVCEFKDLCI